MRLSAVEDHVPAALLLPVGEERVDRGRKEGKRKRREKGRRKVGRGQ